MPGFFERVARRRRIGRARLRWSIKISAPNDRTGDVWGDLAFANDLAAALRRRGQIVFVDRFETRDRPSPDYVDDVTVVLRGLRQFSPFPNSLSYLWVISHPELVTDTELKSGWTRVFAASECWSKARSGDSEIHVESMLQATDALRFRPGVTETSHDVLFVGTTRGVRRPVILDAVETGADVTIYGHGWEEFVDSCHIRDQFLAFDLVPDAYRGARRVLNDHWDDMRTHGFISNRLFDAVASGALVVSDEVAGIEKLFGGSVRTYGSTEELQRLLTSDDGWPGKDQRMTNAHHIAEMHSFDARAGVLLQYAVGDLAGKSRRPSQLIRAIWRRAFRANETET